MMEWLVVYSMVHWGPWGGNVHCMVSRERRPGNHWRRGWSSDQGRCHRYWREDRGSMVPWSQV